MRETIHDTTTDRPSERLPAATRRGVLAAALAGALLPAATDAGAAPSNGADSELIAVCAEFEELERKKWNIADGPSAIADDDEYAAACAPMDRQIEELLDRMERLRASSAGGIQARARTLALHTITLRKGDFIKDDSIYGFDDYAGISSRLLDYLVRDARALGQTRLTHSAPLPDAELLAAIAEFDGLERQQRALYDGGIDYDDECLKRVTQPARDRQRALLRTICHLRATRPETQLARAKSLALYEQQYEEPDPDGYVDQALRNALLRDLREGRA